MIPTLENRVTDHDIRLTRIEAIIEQINHRLISIDNRLTSLENRTTSLENRMIGLFKWVIGLQFTILLAILGAVITILLNLPK